MFCSLKCGDVLKIGGHGLLRPPNASLCLSRIPGNSVTHSSFSTGQRRTEGRGTVGTDPPPPELSDKVGRSGVERAVCWGHVRHPGLWGGGREQRGGSQGPQEERVKGLREDKKGNPLLSHRVTRANRRRIQPQMSKTHLEKYIRSKSSLACYVSNEGIQRKKKRNYPKCNRVPNVTSTDVI